MRLTLPVVAALLCLCAPAHSMARVPPNTQALPPLAPLASARPAFAPGEVLVLVPQGSALRVQPGGTLSVRDARVASMLAGLGIERTEILGAAQPGGSRRHVGLRLVSARADFDPYAAARELVASGAVTAAAPNLRMQLHAVPNDPYLSTQWHLGVSTAAVRARQAWDRQTGSPGVVIGIMDSGVDLEHSDMFSKIWTNPGEIPANGLDDDFNGWQDDAKGWDFGESDNDPNPEPFFDPVYGIDQGWHGTFVAGIAAGATNNGIGIAGVAWGCSVMPLKVNDSAGDILLSAITGAFDFAIAHQIEVLNLSFGTADTSAAGFFQLLVNDAFDAGIVVVAAAGNDGTDTPQWPAACDSVLAVASTNASNSRSAFSNWGGYVDIAAPGEGMWSCIARNYPYDDTSLLFFEILWGFDGVHAYMFGDGTSFSAPVVAGAAALLRSHYPSMSPRMVMQQLVVNGDVRLYDNPIGPRLNIDRALANPLAVDDRLTPAALSLAPPSPNPARSATRLSFALPRPGHARLELLDAQGRSVRTLFDGQAAAGVQETTWDLRDARGGVVSAGLYFAQLRTDGRREVRRVVVLP